jgi:hypothetical protein
MNCVRGVGEDAGTHHENIDDDDKQRAVEDGVK